MRIVTKYKKVFHQKDKQQDLVNHLKKIDYHQDKAMVSRYVSGDCKPSYYMLNHICAFLGCLPNDLYQDEELVYLPIQKQTVQVATLLQQTRQLSKIDKVYKLTVEMDSKVASIVFHPYVLNELNAINNSNLTRKLFQILADEIRSKVNLKNKG